MNTSCRVPGITRNSGWRSVDAEIGAHRLDHQQLETPHAAAVRQGFELVVGPEPSLQPGQGPAAAAR